MPVSSGTRLGPYEIVAPLGAGGMGEVYRARDTRLDREVAVKVLPAHLSGSSEARQRFEREARSASSLNHPNICTVFDIGTQDGIDFLVMELLDGETLAQRLERGPIPLDEVLEIALPLADALDRAHRNGLIHRDLKPGNVMLTRGGVKLLDFGLAKGIESASASNLTATPTMSSPLTAAGMIVGTFQYLAPEQIEGREADARTDLWAFGVMLHEMATGARAFEGKTQASLMASILKEEPPPISGLHPGTPPVFDRIVRRCLSKDPEERWQTARDLAAELQWLAAGGAGVDATAAPAAATPAPRPRWAWIAGAVAAAVLFAAGWWLRPATAPPPVIRSSLILPVGTELDTDNASLALSPDGSTLAYAASDAGGRSGLWVRRLDSMDSQPLAGTEGATYPFWSPDGHQLGFFAAGKLRRIPSGGGTPQTICDALQGRGASWGADGVIVFTPQAFGGLFKVAAAGGTPTPATTAEGSDWTHRNPHFLPDGKRLLYFAGKPAKDGSGEIRSLDVATGESAPVLQVESEGIYVEPGYLAFVREGNLMVQPIDEGSLRLTGEAVPIVEQVQFNTFRWTGTYTFSPTGLLLFRSGAIQSKGQLTWLDLEGNTLGTVGEPARFWLNLAISPDGRRAVAAVRQVDGKSELWMYDLERGLGGPFTFGDTPAVNPRWSPDGKEVAFIDGSGSSFVKDAEGTGEPRLLTSALNGILMGWTPDGSRLLGANQTGGQVDLMLFSVTGDPEPVAFHPTPSNETTAQLSPDGRWLAFLSDESGRNEVYVISFAGPGGKWQISSTGAASLAWRPDGRGILYESSDGKLLGVSVTVEGTGLRIGPPQTLFDAREAGFAGTSTWAIAPDGRRILAAVRQQAEVAPALSLVSNWVAAIRP